MLLGPLPPPRRSRPYAKDMLRAQDTQEFRLVVAAAADALGELICQGMRAQG